jgi:NADPH2:quinone reductase
VPKVGPGQVLVRLAAIGVNPIETYIRNGSFAVKSSLPYTLLRIAFDIGMEVRQ